MSELPPPAAEADRYPISTQFESGRRQDRPSSAEFRNALRSIGHTCEPWLIAEPVADVAESFFQVLRESDTQYRVEIRDGGADRHLAALVETVEAVDALMASWSQGDDGWRTACAWEHFESFDSDVEPDAEIAEQAEALARELVALGSLRRWDVMQGLTDTYSESGGRLGLVKPQAERIVARAWAERLAAQADWPERTDPDALQEAFDGLERAGIVARADFTCCGNCGHTEIGAEVSPDSRGYVFFHRQAAEGVVANGWLYLLYGACGTDRSQDAVIGREIADAVTAAGLPVVWDGDGGKAIRVGPITWSKRLPGSVPA